MYSKTYYLFFLEKLLMYSKIIILEIEISVLKANGIKHNEYSIRLCKSFLGRSKTLNLTY